MDEIEIKERAMVKIMIRHGRYYLLAILGVVLAYLLLTAAAHQLNFCFTWPNGCPYVYYHIIHAIPGALLGCVIALISIPVQSKLSQRFDKELSEEMDRIKEREKAKSLGHD